VIVQDRVPGRSQEPLNCLNRTETSAHIKLTDQISMQSRTCKNHLNRIFSTDHRPKTISSQRDDLKGSAASRDLVGASSSTAGSLQSGSSSSSPPASVDLSAGQRDEGGGMLGTTREHEGGRWCHGPWRRPPSPSGDRRAVVPRWRLCSAPHHPPPLACLVTWGLDRIGYRDLALCDRKYIRV
jgi:hypothetical protein